MNFNNNTGSHYKNRRNSRAKNLLYGFGVTAVLCLLFAATTAVFIWNFRRMDEQKAVQKQQSGVPVSVSSAAEPSGASSAPASSAQSFSVSSAQPAQSGDWRLVLVNYDNEMPKNFESRLVTAFGLQMDSRIVQPYKDMQAAAQKDGVTLWLSSAYRSPEKQQALFEQEIKNYEKKGADTVEAIAGAEQSVARPGYSEHNTGLAIDLNGVKEDFGGTSASNWLEQHAPEYGFILRYPKDKQEITKIKYEPWHYRYVGAENAKKMKDRNLCLEEYVAYLKKNTDSGN